MNMQYIACSRLSDPSVSIHSGSSSLTNAEICNAAELQDDTGRDTVTKA